MSFNLVDLVKGQLGGPALGQLGSLLGEDSSKTEAALGAAIPGLLSGLTNSANADNGGSLFNAIKDSDDSMLDDIGGLLTGGNSSNVMDQGSNLLGSLLGGGAMGGLASAVAGLTGIGGKSSSGLLGLLAPIVMGIIKRKLFGGSGFSQNASGLMGLLNDQQSNIQAAMPSGFSDQLQSSGFMDQISQLGGGAANAVTSAAGNVADAAGNAASSAANTVGNAAGSAADAAGDAAASGGGMIKKILPIAIVVALALFAWKYFTGGSAPDASDTVSSAVDAAKDAMPSIDVDGTDVGAEFGSIFSSATSTIEGITDVDSAKAAIPAFGDITGKVDGLSGLWDKVPEAGRGQLGSMVSDNIGKITPMLDKAQEIPGVGDVLGPVTGPLLEKLMAFTK